MTDTAIPAERLEKLKRRSWVNPYVLGIMEKPDYIIPCISGSLTADDILAVRTRCKDFTRVVCELGSGSGGFLLSKAAQDPSTLWIGFELRFKRTYRTAEKAEQAGLQNVLLVHTRAQEVGRIFEAGSLEAVYVNFPDPWEKKHQEKHRLLKPEFIDQILTLLRPGGVLAYKTDHHPNFKRVLEYLNGKPDLAIQKLTYDLHSSEWMANNVWTEFERLFQSQRKPIAMLEASLR